MSNSTVFKSAGTCTDTSLPILYRDPAISVGSLFCYDALDTYSWPTQAAPGGAASLVDLSPVAANASIAAVALGWSNGFVFDSADADMITLPTSSKLASGVTSFGVSFWFKPATIVGSGKDIFGIGDGGSFALVQYSLHRDLGAVYAYANGTQISSVPIVAGTVVQIGITIELSGGTYTRRIWKNGVNTSTTTNAAPMVQPTMPAAVIGGLAGVHGANGDDFTFYRCHADSLTTRTAAQFIAADYAAGVGRFS